MFQNNITMGNVYILRLFSSFIFYSALKKVEWSNADGESLVLTFSSSTNRPRLNDAVSINNAVTFNHGGIELVAGRGAWSPGGEALTITDLDAESWRDIVAAISDGTFHATPRKKLLVGAEGWGADQSGTSSDPAAQQLRGNLTIRMTFPGRFVAHLFVGEHMDSTSAQVIDVQLCPNEVLLAAPKHPPRGNSEVPRPVFFAEGVLSLPGDKYLKASRLQRVRTLFPRVYLSHAQLSVANGMDYKIYPRRYIV